MDAGVGRTFAAGTVTGKKHNGSELEHVEPKPGLKMIKELSAFKAMTKIVR